MQRSSALFRSSCRGVVLALLPAVLVGCGGNDTSDPEPSTTSGSPSTSVTSSTRDPSEPNGTFSKFEPASGDEIELTALTLSIPDDYSVTKQGGLNAVASWDKYATDSITVISTIGSDKSLERARKQFNYGAGYDVEENLRAEKPVVVDGVRMFHESGRLSQSTVLVEAFGAITQGRFLSIEFDFDTLTKAQRRKEVVESVMASVQLDLG